jgi:hypothetical protein
MKTTRFSFLLLSVYTFGLVACGQSDSPQNQGAGKGPIDILSNSAAAEKGDQQTTITWLDSTYWNAGKITEGAKLSVAFRFRNSGTKPLVIESVTASCGCTAPEPPKEPIAPGKEGVIAATFDSKGRVGQNHKTLTVVANTIGSATHELNFDVEVIEKK